jgi:hypothetical protein
MDTVASERQFAEPLPDLEQQLAAELEGISWAVVAFARQDGAWCDWIYRNLNGYPLPESLVDRVTPHGFPRPDCLSIFPDRRDPTSRERMVQVLESSAYLIVVCSPRSSHSASVDEQIRAFKKAGGEERIIALVVDGAPDLQLGELPQAAECDWLPSWLRWRLVEDGFLTADRSEPRVVDARSGYRSLKQVRDSLLAALVDMDAAELERLDGFERPVEAAPPGPSPTTTQGLLAVPPLPNPPVVAGQNSTYTVWTALALIVLAVLFGTKSFVEITAEESPSMLAVHPVTGVRSGRTARPKEAELEPASPVPEPTLSEPPAPLLLADVSPAPRVEPPRFIPPASRPNVSQVAPVSVFATSRVEPSTVVAPPATITVAAPVASTPAQDAVLLDEVKTLERRGDETMAERRVDDALDLYGTALDSALEYASRKDSTVADKDHVVTLLRKVALLQGQNSSTAEARATFQQARKTLLKLKAQGSWTRERAKALDEMETRLVKLPRD